MIRNLGFLLAPIVYMACVAGSPRQQSQPQGYAYGPPQGSACCGNGEDGGEYVEVGGHSGGTQVCGSGGTCSLDCHEGGCGYVCEPGATCNLDCEGGGCEMTCMAGATCNLDCEGGGCNSVCADGATCNTDCEGGGCGQRCDDASSCNLDCDGGGCHG